ncbi:tyrosine-protein phosphatase [Flammeovirga sp. SubArs3]|uniref:tyrosine-protein phosphatase n=1 Tax=Flammeovirga sp. SubArs3 TaxID=2995316 RepID=UPI00248B3D2F|nr:tyrosine-protein phosphatase [Flammeovirga sp. SubArs3]
MGLDYTDGCVNFRDFGGYINLILDKDCLPENRLFRGGSIEYIKDLSEIKNTVSVFNLRNGPDYHDFDIDYYHFPMANKVEKYDTTTKEVRVWLNTIIKQFEDEQLKYPVLIHCLSGKDRTGIVVAAILLILGINEKAIEEEYLLSEGEVKLELIRQSIEGMKDISNYFNRVNLPLVRKNLLGK